MFYTIVLATVYMADLAAASVLRDWDRSSSKTLLARQSNSSADSATDYLNYQGTPLNRTSTQNAPSGAPIVRLTNGSYYGTAMPSFNLEQFLGMPYAQPVTGLNRFRGPQTINETWSGYRNATNFGPACPSSGAFPIVTNSVNQLGGYWTMEDCLTLDVYRPANTTSTSALPVMIWFYGGGGITGNSADQSHNGSYALRSAIARGQPYVDVQFNYRMLSWGFLGGQEMTMDGSLNLYLQDQRAAMRWVKDNIAAFGGDPSKITLYGESYGAITIGQHLLYNNGDTEGLYRGVIMSSGTATAQPIVAASTGQALFDYLANATGCAGVTQKLTCIRQAPFATVARALNATSTTLVVSGAAYFDGVYFKRYPHESMTKGLYAKVPMLIGGTRDEGTGFIFPLPVPNTTEGLRQALKSHLYFPNALLTDVTINRTLELYPDDPAQGAPFNGLNYTIPSNGGQFRRAAAISGDCGLIQARRNDAGLFANTQPVWAFQFSTYPWNKGDRSLDMTNGVPHGADNPFVFQTIAGALGNNSQYLALSNAVRSQYVNFATNLDPNIGPSTNITIIWPRYNSSTAALLIQNATGSPPNTLIVDDYRKEQLAFWRSVAYDLRV